MQEGWGDVLHGVEKRAARLARPVFDGGRLRAQGELSEARFDELLAHYRATTLQAFSEVDLALGEIESLARQDEQQALVGLYRSLGGLERDGLTLDPAVPPWAAAASFMASTAVRSSHDRACQPPSGNRREPISYHRYCGRRS
nr:hypothetical protein [Halomonas socia]